MGEAFHSRSSRRGLQVIVLVVGAAAAMPAMATDYHWNVANGTWQNGPNWNPFGEPMTSDRALIDFASNATCHVLTGVPEIAQVSITRGDTLSLEHDGVFDGAVVDDGDFFVGGSSAGTLNVLPRAGGIKFTGQGHLFVGGTTSGLVVGPNGTVNQSGGLVTVGSESDLNSKLRVTTNSYYDFTGGTLTAGYATLTNGGSLNISNGEVDVSGMLINNSAQAVLNSGSLNIQNIGAGTGELLIEANFSQNGGTLAAAATTLDTPGAFVQYNHGTLSCGDLSIHAAAAVVVSSGGDKVVRVSSVHIDPAAPNIGGYVGGIDLADNAMVVDYSTSSPLLTIAQYIAKSGFDGTNQVPTGIYSSTAAQNTSGHPMALGYAESSAAGITTLLGQSIDNTSVVIRYTYRGDANLDGIVNTLDFNALASNYGKSARWYQGDFDGNGTVDSSDFALLAMNFGRSLPVSSSVPGQLVPEPASLAAIGILLCTLRRSVHSRSVG